MAAPSGGDSQVARAKKKALEATEKALSIYKKAHDAAPDAEERSDDGGAPHEEELPVVEAPAGRPQPGDPRRKKPGVRRAPTPPPCMFAADEEQKPSLPPLVLIESLTSKWKHNTEKMVVQLVHQHADVRARLKEPWDEVFSDYRQTIGATALHFASRRGLNELVQALIEYRAEVDSQTHTGTTPLMAAVMFTQVETVSVLIAARASVLIMDNEGFSATDIAILEGNLSVQRIILEAERAEEERRERAMLEDPELFDTSNTRRSKHAAPSSAAARAHGAVPASESSGAHGKALAAPADPSPEQRQASHEEET